MQPREIFPVLPSSVRVIGVVPTLTLDQIYTAIILDDPEADVIMAFEGSFPAGLDLWIGPIDLSPRLCVQRQFFMWGDPCMTVTFGIDSQDRTVGPFYFPPAPATFTFARYWQKKTVYIRLTNTDLLNPAEYHIVGNLIMPKLEAWDTIWMKRIMAQVKALKGEE